MATRKVPFFLGIDNDLTKQPKLDDTFYRLLRQALLTALHERGMLSLPQFHHALRSLKYPEGDSGL